MFDSLIFIILLIIALAVLFKIIKSIVKVAITGVLIILVLSAILGLVIFQDIGSIKNATKSEHILYLEAQNGTMVRGFDNNQTIGPEILAGYGPMYMKGDLKGIKGDYDRVIIFNDKNVANPELYIRTTDTGTLYKWFKNGNIIAYPNGLFFSLAQKAPSWLVKPALWVL
jgi:hypothetical protein